jgi:hypothetical protein
VAVLEETALLEEIHTAVPVAHLVEAELMPHQFNLIQLHMLELQDKVIMEVMVLTL